MVQEELALSFKKSIFKFEYRLNDFSYSLRRYYVDIFYENCISDLKEGSLVIDIGGKKKNKRGFFNIENFQLKIEYANIEESTCPDYICDATSIPVSNDKYDAVIMGELLEHVPNPVLVLKEAFRILKPGGKIFVTVPFHFHIHADPFDYGRYTDYWFLENLTNIGFKDINIQKQGLFFGVMANMIRLAYNEYRNKKKLSFISKFIFIRIIRFITRVFLKWDFKPFASNSKLLSSYTTGFGIICKK